KPLESVAIKAASRRRARLSYSDSTTSEAAGSRCREARPAGGEMAESPSLGLESLASRIGKGRKPPVEKWNPPYCGEIDMRIATDGTWFYLGTPIGRPAL